MAKGTTKSLEERVAEKFKDEDSQQIVKQWLQGKSEGSRISYLSFFEKYCRYAKKTPRQLIEERTQDYATKEGESHMEALLRRKRAEAEFQEVFEAIEKGGEKLAARTLGTARLVVKAFYSYIGFSLCKTDTPYRKAKQRKWRDVELAQGDYSALVEIADAREKLRTVWLGATGMRLGDVQKLKVRDLTEFDLEKLEAVKVPMAIDYLPEKTEGREIGERYTFLCEYGVDLLKTELYNRIEKDGIEAVRDQFLFMGIGKGGAALGSQQWVLMLKTLAKKARLKIDGKHGRIRPHCFRKYFDSNLTGHNVNKNVIYWMMGHALEGQEETYFRGQVQKENLRKIYADVEQYLTPIRTQTIEIEKTEIVEKAVIPVEVYDEMKGLRNELDEQKQRFTELREDFDKMMAYMTEEGKKRIFGEKE